MKALSFWSAVLLAASVVGCSSLSKPDEIRVVKDIPKPPEPEPAAAVVVPDGPAPIELANPAAAARRTGG